MALPASGSLSIKTAAGSSNSIAQEVDGNTTGSKSLTTLSTTAGKTAPHGMQEFYSYSSGTPPGEPSNVVLVQTGVGGDTLQLTYDAPTTGGAVTNYRIERSENGSGFIFLVDNGTSLSYNYTGFTRGNTYVLRVRAENSAGSSAYVNSNSVTTS